MVLSYSIYFFSRKKTSKTEIVAPQVVSLELLCITPMIEPQTWAQGCFVLSSNHPVGHGLLIS